MTGPRLPQNPYLNQNFRYTTPSQGYYQQTPVSLPPLTPVDTSFPYQMSTSSPLGSPKEQAIISPVLGRESSLGFDPTTLGRASSLEFAPMSAPNLVREPSIEFSPMNDGSMNGPMNVPMYVPMYASVNGPMYSSVNGPVYASVNVPMNASMNGSMYTSMNNSFSSPDQSALHLSSLMASTDPLNDAATSSSFSSSSSSSKPAAPFEQAYVSHESKQTIVNENQNQNQNQNHNHNYHTDDKQTKPNLKRKAAETKTPETQALERKIQVPVGSTGQAITSLQPIIGKHNANLKFIRFQSKLKDILLKAMECISEFQPESKKFSSEEKLFVFELIKAIRLIVDTPNSPLYKNLLIQKYAIQFKMCATYSRC